MRNKLTLTSGIEYETKGAVRYQQLDDRGLPEHPDRAIVPTLYIRKHYLRQFKGLPGRLTLTLEHDAAPIASPLEAL